jgi:hypothetical protein
MSAHDCQAAAREPHWQHAIEQLAGAANEWPPDPVLVAAGRLADQHQARIGRTIRKDQPCRRRFQGAAVEFLKQFAQFIQILRGGRQGASRPSRIVGRRRDRLQSRRRDGRDDGCGFGLGRRTFGEAIMRGLVDRQIHARLDPPAQSLGRLSRVEDVEDGRRTFWRHEQGLDDDRQVWEGTRPASVWFSIAFPGAESPVDIWRAPVQNSA